MSTRPLDQLPETDKPLTENETRPIRWGILGTGQIVREMAPAIKIARKCQLLAIGGRETEDATEAVQVYDGARAYGEFQQVIDDPDVDAVYIALPPSLHPEWTIKAAEAGKHVLCEKPLCVTDEDAERMVEVCRKNNVNLMDGTMWYHHPRTKEMLDIVRGGKLGEVQRVTSAMSFPGHKWMEPNNIRNSPELGGGSLLDVGWYCVGAILLAFDRMPTRVFGTAHYQHGVDYSFTGILWFGEQAVGTFDSSFELNIRHWLEIAGGEGSLVCDDFNKPAWVDKHRYWVHDLMGGAEEKRSEIVLQEKLMVEHFAEAILANEIHPEWADMSLRTQKICNLLLRSAKEGKILDVPPTWG